MPKGLALTINYGEEKALVLALRAEVWVSTCLWGGGVSSSTPLLC